MWIIKQQVADWSDQRWSTTWPSARWTFAERSSKDLAAVFQHHLSRRWIFVNPPIALKNLLRKSCRFSRFKRARIFARKFELRTYDKVIFLVVVYIKRSGPVISNSVGLAESTSIETGWIIDNWGQIKILEDRMEPWCGIPGGEAHWG